MRTPTIKYYALLEKVEAGKTPKYVVTYASGNYPPMEELRGKGEAIAMYLTEKLKDGERVPAMRLQAKNSLNFTGLKDYFTADGQLSGYAYGYPPSTPTYSGKQRENPFYQWREDGFLFIVHQENPNSLTPTSIELLVIDGGKGYITAECKRLAMGGYDETINKLRQSNV